MAGVIVRYEIKVKNQIEERFVVYSDEILAKRDIDLSMRRNKDITGADIAPITERVSRLGEMPIMVEVN